VFDAGTTTWLAGRAVHVRGTRIADVVPATERHPPSTSTWPATASCPPARTGSSAPALGTTDPWTVTASIAPLHLSRCLELILAHGIPPSSPTHHDITAPHDMTQAGARRGDGK
jgi:hypothetical protein